MKYNSAESLVLATEAVVRAAYIKITATQPGHPSMGRRNGQRVA